MRFRSFILCLTIVLFRCRDRIMHAGIWAEDGTLFLNGALTQGWQAVFQPFEGYYHLFGRVVMQLIVSLFPLAWAPTLICVSTLVLYAWVLSMFADRTYRHLVRSDWNRVFIAVGFCIIPGGYEIFGNFANTHRILALYIFFLALRSVQDKIKVWHLIATFIVAGSAGEAFIFLPMLLYRGYQTYKISPSLKSLAGDIAAIAIIVGWTLATFAVRHTNSSTMNQDYQGLARSTLAALTFGFALEPTLGWRLTENLYNHVRVLFWLFAGGFGFILIRDAIRNLQNSRINIYIGAACLFAFMELSWIVRPYDMDIFRDFMPGMWWGNTRLVYMLTFGGFFLWAVYFAQKSKKWGIAFVLLYFVLCNRLEIKSYGDVSFWPETAAQLEQSMRSGNPQEVRVKLFPENWEFTYKSPLVSSR